MINKDIEKIFSIITEMSRESNYHKLLEDILRVGMEISNCDAGTLYLHKDNYLEFFYMITKSLGIIDGGTKNKINLPPVELDFQSVASLCAKTKEVINVPDVYSDKKYNWTGPMKYDEITGYHTKSVLVLPLFDKGKNVLGVMQLINAQDENGIIPFEKDVEETLYSLATISGVLLDNLNLYDNLKDLLDSFVSSMVKAIESRTPYNASHTINVAKYAGGFVDYLNENKLDEISLDDKEELVMASMLHDVGKMIIKVDILNKATRFGSLFDNMMLRYDLISSTLDTKYYQKELSDSEYKEEKDLISDIKSFIKRINNSSFLSQEDLDYIEKIKKKEYNTEYGILRILSKEEEECAYIRKGTLTESERKEIERHVIYTNEILSELKFGKKYSNVKNIASLHHEYLDGSGYPNHYKADKLSKYVRIITICDIYDSLLAADRPYKKPMPNEKALAILKEMADMGKLDKDLVSAFCHYRGE